MPPNEDLRALAAPRHDDGAVPLRPPPARAAGRPPRGRLRARHAVRGRLPRVVAGRARDPLRLRELAARDPRGAQITTQALVLVGPALGDRRRRPGARTSTTRATGTATGRSGGPTATEEGAARERRAVPRVAVGAAAARRAARAARREAARVARCVGVAAGGASRRGAEELLAGATVVAGGRARPGARARRRPQVPLGADLEPALAALAEAGAGVRARLGRPRLLRDRPRAWASARARARSTCAPRRRRSRSRSRGSACRGTTRSSSAPTAARRTPRVHTALRHPKVAILTEPRAPGRRVRRRAGAAAAARVTVAERLGTPAERLVTGTPEELAGRAFAEPNVVVVLDPGRRRARRVAAAPARLGAARRRVRAPRRAWSRRREVRALALAAARARAPATSCGTSAAAAARSRSSARASARRRSARPRPRRRRAHARATPPRTACRCAPSSGRAPEALAGAARPRRGVRRRRRRRPRRDPRRASPRARAAPSS